MSTDQLASNKDRSKALAALHQAVVDGRLTTERFEQRTQSILESETLADINASLQGLGIELQAAPTVYIQSEEDDSENIPEAAESEVVLSEDDAGDTAAAAEISIVEDAAVVVDQSAKSSLLSQVRVGLTCGAVLLSVFGPIGYFIDYVHDQRVQYSKDYQAMVAKQTSSTLQPLADAIKAKAQQNPNQSLNQVIQQINQKHPNANIIMNIDRAAWKPGQTLIETYGVNGYKMLVFDQLSIKAQEDTMPWSSLQANAMTDVPKASHGDYVDFGSNKDYPDTDFDY